MYSEKHNRHKDSPTPDRIYPENNPNSKKPPLQPGAQGITRKNSLSQRYSPWNKIHFNDLFNRFDSTQNRQSKSNSRETTPLLSSKRSSSPKPPISKVDSYDKLISTMQRKESTPLLRDRPGSFRSKTSKMGLLSTTYSNSASILNNNNKRHSTDYLSGFCKN